MNKYQDTLNWLRETTISLKHNQAYNILQELVDKATGQKKHIKNCKEREYLNHNYCYACGQKLDWSDTD